MKTKSLGMLRGAAVVAVILVALLAASASAWAPSPWQSDEPNPDAYPAMHDSCSGEDVQGMAAAMDELTTEDLKTMDAHMGDGHHRAMGAGMMGFGRGMMDW